MKISHLRYGWEKNDHRRAWVPKNSDALAAASSNTKQTAGQYE
jgi:hypothetical protein